MVEGKTEFERGAFSAGQEVEDGCGVRYRFLRIVGTGSFSIVVEAREITDGKPSSETVAIKKILCLPMYRVCEKKKKRWYLMV